jgi:hypothetical protein
MRAHSDQIRIYLSLRLEDGGNRIVLHHHHAMR